MKPYPERDEIINRIRAMLVGPKDGTKESFSGSPYLRYMTGMLFPKKATVSQLAEVVSADGDDELAQPVENRDDISGSDPTCLQLTSEALPSAVGLSFHVDSKGPIRCEIWAAIYQRRDQSPKGSGRAGEVWSRIELGTPELPICIDLAPDSNRESVFDGRATLGARRRAAADGGFVVTVSLVNEQVAKSGADEPASTLFQVGMRCRMPSGNILPYPAVGTFHGPTSEEAEVAYLYRREMPYARGHGAAANWGCYGIEQNRCEWVAIEHIPTADIPYPTFLLAGAAIVDERCYQLDFLQGSSRKEVLRALRTISEAYQTWMDDQAKQTIEAEFAQASQLALERAKHWCLRIGKGLSILEADETAWKAFQLANRAMGIQMCLIENQRSRGSQKGGPFLRSENRTTPDLNFNGKIWRPFQIAFLLASIETLMDPACPDRDIVDVIWFPTGGGKTEAYLLLGAFELIRRRLQEGARDTATAILSRYTLRFLTADQFQRTSALVAALELLRFEDSETLGDRQFTLGLWAGNPLTPNYFRDACRIHQEQLDARTPRNPFLLVACPCCGTEIYPENPVRLPNGDANPREFGVVATDVAFYFRCPSEACPFHDRLPLNVVDEALYAAPPSILLGTIDKFAMLPWDNRARAFFGGPDDNSLPPSLIIQDELHLISGPLGSLAAPYEAAIDTVIELRGVRAKRIGSTATIRNAADQVQGLYGRKSAVFPTPIHAWDNAFFFRTDNERPGRRYVGVMAQGHVKPVVAMTWTSASILQSVHEANVSEAVKDAYWTLLAYHNSRRELGRTMTAARDEIATRIQALEPSEARARQLILDPLELSAQMVKSMSEARTELERRHSDRESAVDFAPCTSIISVGVDIPRLGIMLVNGQPKLTSEYIQATSRVGRGNIPGLVVSLFSPAKPRDRSHYEDFRAYHEAIYRYVEPTSVTPYAIPVRERTLHAALVTLMRHWSRWNDNEDARAVDFSELTTIKAIERLLSTMCTADPAEANAIKSDMNALIEEWREATEAGDPIYYEVTNAGPQFRGLLRDFAKKRGSGFWKTMRSVRNVDAEVKIQVC